MTHPGDMSFPPLASFRRTLSFPRKRESRASIVSFPRKRESRASIVSFPRTRESRVSRGWTPAFAGVTVGAGVTAGAGARGTAALPSVNAGAANVQGIGYGG